MYCFYTITLAIFNGLLYYIIVNVRNQIEKVRQTESARLNSNRFLYSPYYPPAVMLLVTIFYFLKLPLVGLACLVVIGSIVVLSSRDFTPILPPLFSVIMLFSDLNIFNGFWVYLTFLPFVVCLVIHYVLYPIKNFKLGKLFFPLLFTLIALCLGGIGSNYLVSSYVHGLMTIATIGLLLIVEYVVLRQQLSPPKDFSLSQYFSITMITTTLAACLQLMCYKAYYVGTDVLLSTKIFGWANPNHIACMILLTMPLCFYMLQATKDLYLYSTLIVSLLVFMYFTGSDACLIILLIITLFLVFATYQTLSVDKRNLYFKIFGLIIACMIIILILLIELEKIDVVSYIYHHFFSASGRGNLYLKARQLFLSAPFFGNSLGVVITLNIMGINFHSTLFHVLATMGIFGLLVYAYNYYVKIKLLATNNTPIGIYLICSFLAYEIYAMVDTAVFSMLMIYVTAFLLIAEMTTTKNEQLPLPLIKYRHNNVMKY